MDIFKLSPFVENQFKKTPELKALISDNFDLDDDWTYYKQSNTTLDIFSLLRTYRQSRLALIATRDLTYTKPEQHIKTLKQTSRLAKILISHAYDFALNEIQDKYGTVVNQENEKGQEEQTFIIYALGKLGGNELNYSSDVDLVFCYSDNGESTGKKTLDAQRYFLKLGRRIIQLLDTVTQNGITYRVDMRLRPFGSAAPLVCSVSNLQTYLEIEGRDWERYAWLRASFVAGNAQLANETLSAIQPFIYRKYLDFNIYESLRQIKAQITRKQIDDLDNIKLGLGGIREIEFIIQTLQLTFAGRNKQLRGNDLWQQMHNLHDFNHISLKELRQLTSAWLFLRKLENLCQIINDKDQHHLPDDSQPIAQSMGFQYVEQLNNQLQVHRNNVHCIFENLFLINQTSKIETLSPPQIQEIKDKISNKNFPKAIKHKIYSALDAAVPLLSKFDNQTDIINQYHNIIKAICKRSSYLSMLIESPLILQKLLQQISYSHYFANAVVKMPSLLELLFEQLEDNDFDVDFQWQLTTNKHHLDDDEQYLEMLCQFKQRMQFKTIMAYVDEIHNAKTTGKILSNLAQFILSLVIKKSLVQVQETKNYFISEDLIVIAYGSLAMQTMHLKSDFDIVFIIDKTITDDNHKTLMRWIKRIVHLLSIQTYSGTLYKLDTQLRPNGKSGAAVVTKNNFENYQINDAWTWEHAALIKTRTVYASTEQQTWFAHLRKKVIQKKRNPQLVDQELSEMAKKLYLQNTNDHQQEFTLLGNILKQAHENPKMMDSVFISTHISLSKLNQSILE